MKTNIIITGMPGSGKSTIGKLLAKKTGMPFIDTDALIEEEYGCRLEDIINERGKQGFLQAENEVVSRISPENSIVATGGSVIYGKEEMENLISLGPIVYICISLEELERRCVDMAERGVPIQPGETIADIYAERIPIYEKFADVTAFCDGTTPESATDALLNDLRNKGFI